MEWGGKSLYNERESPILLAEGVAFWEKSMESKGVAEKRDQEEEEGRKRKKGRKIQSPLMAIVLNFRARD